MDRVHYSKPEEGREQDVFQIVMFVERCVATLFYRCYERKGKRLGNIFLATSVRATQYPDAISIPDGYSCLFDILYFLWPAQNCTSNQRPEYSSPSGADRHLPHAVSVFPQCWCRPHVVDTVLYQQEEDRNVGRLKGTKTKTFRGNESLSARYQKAENAVSSKFLAFVIFGTLVLIAAYGGATAYLKIKFSPEEQVCGVFYKSYIMIAYVSVRQVAEQWQTFQTIPLYTVIFPGMVLFGIKQMEKRRHNKVENLIQVT